MGPTATHATRYGWLARSSLIGAAALMGLALLATVWSTYRAVARASETLVRGETGSFLEGLRALGRDGVLTDADLAILVEERGEDGLRYIALLDADGRAVAEAGASASPPAELAREVARAPLGEPIAVGERVRVVHRRPHRGPRPPMARGRMVLEFEPRMAVQLEVAARRALGIGALAASGFLLIAVLLVRWFLRNARLERVREHERRLASLGQMSAVMAHEIRNPLTSLKGNAQLLARALPEGERSRARADRVVDEAVRLEALCNDLLEFARSGALERRDVAPAALLRDAVAAAGDGLVEVVDAGAPATWSLDAARMRQVLVNLVENAVHAGGVEPAVATVDRVDGALRFVVRDRGEGIAPDDLPRVFEPFYTRKTRGTGLGLAIARRLVELHGGTIAVDNPQDGGARFEIRIPGAGRDAGGG